MELSKTFLTETNGNGIPFPLPFADRTNGILHSVKACGSKRKHAAANGSMWQLTETDV